MSQKPHFPTTQANSQITDFSSPRAERLNFQTPIFAFSKGKHTFFRNGNSKEELLRNT